MHFLTPSERRAVAVVALLFGLGAGRDLWQATHPRDLPRPRPAAAGPERAPSAESWSPRSLDPSSRGSDSAAAAREGSRRASSPAGAPLPPVNLNRATIEELDRLPGIGPILARRIVEHRERHGGFHDVEELLAVRGIGPRLLERLRPHVRVGAS